MPYLLDTSVFLRALIAPERLNPGARRLLSDESHSLFLSAATSWEIVIKYALGKLVLPATPATWVVSCMRQLGVQSLDITHSHAFELIALPEHHEDPFDRILIAQARHENMALLTTDRIFQKYPVEVIPCGA
jgi:PIN domain nuclease of toxin-antitoxin system